MRFDLGEWSEEVTARVDAALDAMLKTAWPAGFVDAVRYPVFGGGRRFRPLLVMAAARAVGESDALAMSAAAAVELVHTYSLVHDDLPCMDNDDVRRGRPTAHVAYGEAPALLVGDALLTEAFAVLAASGLPAERRIALVGVLAAAAGKDGMVGGQQADITLGGRVTDADALAAIHARKTGALITAAVMMGGIAAGADESVLTQLGAYGQAVGLAFQLADDVLDADEDDGSPSYVRLLGVEETRRRAKALAAQACQLVADLPAPDALMALARFAVERGV